METIFSNVSNQISKPQRKRATNEKNRCVQLSTLNTLIGYEFSQTFSNFLGYTDFPNHYLFHPCSMVRLGFISWVLYNKIACIFS